MNPRPEMTKENTIGTTRGNNDMAPSEEGSLK